MFRVLQIAMVAFVLSLILGLQQCSHEDEPEQKKSVVDESEETQVSHKEETITSKEKNSVEIKEEKRTVATEQKQIVLKKKKIKDALPHAVKKTEENLTTKVADDNESIVIQGLISEIIKEEVNITEKSVPKEIIQKETNNSLQQPIVQVSHEPTKEANNSESDIIKIYFTEPEPNPLEKELAEVKKEQGVKIGKLTTQNQALKSRILELLSLLKQVKEKSEAKDVQLQTLLSSKESLESNLTQEQQKESELFNENETLKAKIAALQEKANANEELNATKAALLEMTQKEEQEQLALQILLANKKSLEENLTQEQQKESELFNENETLKAKIAALQEKANANEELNATKAALLKLQNEYDKKSVVFQETVAAKESLEGNLTQIDEAQKKLREENQALKTELEKMQGTLGQIAVLKKELNVTKESYEKALSEEKNKESTLAEKGQACGLKLTEMLLALKTLKEEKNTQMQGLLSGKQSLEEESVQLKEKYEALMQENGRLKQRMEEEQEVNGQMLKKLQSELEQTEEKMQAIETKKAKQAEVLKEKEELFDQFKLAKVAFKNDSAELTNDSKKRLNTVADTMKKYSHFNYKVQGHTDSSGNPKYNLKLSQIRAKSVKEYLVSQGVDAAILSSEGYGSSMPVASNKNRKGRLKNRRVVFEIIQP